MSYYIMCLNDQFLPMTNIQSHHISATETTVQKLDTMLTFSLLHWPKPTKNVSAISLQNALMRVHSLNT